MDVNKKLKEIIVNVALRQIETASINDETVLTSDLGFDSVQIITLIVELETQFEIDIEDDDLDIERLTVYPYLREMIETKVKTKG